MRQKKISQQAKVINLFFVLLGGFVILNGLALALVQQKMPSVGYAVQTPFTSRDIPVIPSLQSVSAHCVDADNGVDARMPGMVTYFTGTLEGETRFDLCADDILIERSCQNGKLESQKIDCAGLGLHCLEDADVKGYCG